MQLRSGWILLGFYRDFRLCRWDRGSPEGVFFLGRLQFAMRLQSQSPPGYYSFALNPNKHSPMASPSLARCSQRFDRRILSSTGGGGSFSSGKKSAVARISAAAVPRVLIENDDADSGRVWMAVRVGPKNDEDIYLDSEFTDCLEVQPELRRLKLRKSNWSSEFYKFDDEKSCSLVLL